MCIAILNKGKKLEKQQLMNCWENNGDGAGMLFVSGGKLETFKELNNFEVFWNKYERVYEMTAHPILLHFRISTHGIVNKDNCHPFMVDDSLGFIHNGIIYEYGYEHHLSDTNVFNRDVLKQLPKNFLSNAGILELLHVICNGSKLVFLNNHGGFTIINENAGHWSGDNWFSNDSYKRVNSYVWHGNEKVSKKSDTDSLFTYQSNAFDDDCIMCENCRLDVAVTISDTNEMVCEFCYDGQ